MILYSKNSHKLEHISCSGDDFNFLQISFINMKMIPNFIKRIQTNKINITIMVLPGLCGPKEEINKKHLSQKINFELYENIYFFENLYGLSDIQIR